MSGTNRWALLLPGVAALTACGQGDNEGDREGDVGHMAPNEDDGVPTPGGAGALEGPNDTHVYYDADSPCQFSLEQIIDDLENDYAMPTWEMLDCYSDGLTRTRPEFFKRLLSTGDLPGIGMGGDAKQQYIHLDYWDELWERHPVNVSSLMFGTMGPYRTNEMEEIRYPLYPDHIDAVIRKNAAAALREKRAGKPVLWVQFVPPDDDNDGIPLASSVEEFEQYHEEVWIPWHVELAKAAERIHVDYFAAASEFEPLFHRQSILLESLTPEQQVELVQWQIDTIRDAVRPHFSGVLVAYSYVRYAAWGTHWQELSYAGYDEVAFPLLPECDEEGVRTYIQEQLEGYAKVVENSGNIPWRVSELDLLRRQFETLCGTDFAAEEANLYRAAFEILDDPPMPSLPIGVNVLATLVETDAAWDVIDAYFESH